MSEEDREEIELSDDESAASDRALEKLRATDPRFKSPWKKTQEDKDVRPTDPAGGEDAR